MVYPVSGRVAALVAQMKPDLPVRGSPEKGARGRVGDPDGVSLDLLVAEIAQLKERVASLERAAFGAGSEYVEGWPRAARIVGVTVMTCRSRAASGLFPKPCRIEPFARADGRVFGKPVWRRADLVAYAEGC